MMSIDEIMNACNTYDYSDLFLNKLFVIKDWSVEDLIKLKLPFYLHTGEYVQLHEAIKYFTENYSLEERNARIHDYLAIQNQRFAERLTLKRPDIFNWDAFLKMFKLHSGSAWSMRESSLVKALQEIYPNYKLALDFADIEINGSAKVLAYPNFIK